MEEVDFSDASASGKKKRRSSRKYDPGLELTFQDFCKLMDFNEMKIITTEIPSFLGELGVIPIRRSNSLRLPSYVHADAI